MDDEIQFGEVEELGQDVKLRPDQNRHYAVVPVHSPESNDLPIFVEIDVMRDMESHALTDTSVELGGVMLGGQYEDEDGKPFVLVTDSLRAEHYEATKGSFKFTHETWQQISRQRDEFPEEIQMVGWYHTHPDWGVFLSGMDLFICENFFNRPLDLALVIDPCRGDRGWFQWKPDSTNETRRTGGFYLIGSRFRQQEIEYFAFQLKGRLEMASDYRNPGIAGSIGSPSAPVVNISESRNANMQLGLLGLFAMQFLFLAIISWKLLFGGPDSDSVAELRKELVAMNKEKMSEQRIRILEKALTLSGDKTQLAQLLKDKNDLEIQLEDSTAKRMQLTSQNKSLNAKYKITDAENSSLLKEIGSKKDELAKLRKQVTDLKESADTKTTPIWQNSTLVLFVAALGFICGIAGGTVGFIMGRSRSREFEDEEEYESFEIRDDSSQPDKESEKNDESPSDKSSNDD